VADLFARVLPPRRSSTPATGAVELEAPARSLMFIPGFSVGMQP
jgi:hypothetical protein